MPSRGVRSVHIRGNIVTIYMKHGKKDIIDKRMAVDGDWVKLWYDLQEGNFDVNLWRSLGNKEKLFLVRAARTSGVDNKEMEIAHARDQKRDMDRLATLEGEISIGNLSHKLAEEYNDIVDQLGYTYDLNPRYTSQLKHRMANSLKAAQEKN